MVFGYLEDRNAPQVTWKVSGQYCFIASNLSAYGCSNLYTALPHNLIEEKLAELIEQTF